MISNHERAYIWLDVLARGALDEWDGLVAADFVLEAVTMPGPAAAPLQGRAAARDMLARFWRSWSHFAFTDVEIHEAADDSDLVFVSARSSARTGWGTDYSNRYLIQLRFREGELIEHIEFFDPAKVIDAFAGHLP